ncbi:4'-phosphopantetheinyl transferase family protein [Rathayibacter tritici]|nr:hypothetical protein [Rathayibacter tritici]
MYARSEIAPQVRIAGRVQVIWARVHPDTSDWQWLLDDVERTRADRFHREEDRGRFVVAAGLAHLVVGAILGEAPNQPVLDRRCERCGEPHGRPRPLRGIRGCSISHSGSVAGFAWSDSGDVGLDIEERREVSPESLTAAQTIFESEALAQEYDCGGSPLPWWVRKEAVVKLTGEGLQGMPNYTVSTGPNKPGRTFPVRGPEAFDAITTVDIFVDSAHTGAVAFHGRPDLRVIASERQPHDTKYWEELIND